MKLAILLLEDEAEVRAAVERDLLDFAAVLRIEVAEDVEDAWAVIDEINAEGDALAVAVCDHRLPGTTGIDFMGQMMADERTQLTRKILLTGQADLADTVRAVNEAGLDQYLWIRCPLCLAWTRCVPLPLRGAVLRTESLGLRAWD